MQADYSSEYINLWKNHWWWQSRHELVMRTIRKLRKKQRDDERNWNILDIGCGGGVAFEDFAKFGDIYGIEPDEHLAKALPQWSEKIEQRFFDASYQPPRKYDLVVLLDVIEHIEHDEDALLALRKIMAPQGYAIITVPALMSLWSVHDEVNHHFRRYTAANLETLLKSVGFHLERLEYFFSWSLPLMYLRKLLAKKQAEYRVTVPAWPVNTLFKNLSHFENLLRRFHIQFPVGSSLLAVAKIDSNVSEEMLLPAPPSGIRA